MTTIRIARFAEKLFNTHGDVENARVLARRAELWGARVETIAWDGGKWSGPSPQIVAIGSAMEFQWEEAFARLSTSWPTITAWLEEGAVVLAIGTSAEMLGQTVERNGEIVTGLGAHPGRAQSLSAHQSLFVEVSHPGGPLVGFINRDRVIEFTDSDGLGTLTHPDQLHHSPETLITPGLVATALRGPVLAVNPWLADHLLSQMGVTTSPPPPEGIQRLDSHAEEVVERIRRQWDSRK